MLFYLALFIIIAASAVLFIALSSAQFDYFGSRSVKEITKSDKIQKSALEEFDQKFGFGDNYIGEGNASKVLLIGILIIVSSFWSAFDMTNPQLGIFLGVVMSAAYLARTIFHFTARFRDKVLSQLERVFLTIRNNLSTGMTLDYAVNEAIKYTKDKPLGPHLTSFVKVSEGNFLEKFPSWLYSVQRNFRIQELAESAHLLHLELKHTNNQEEAFINAARKVSDKHRANKKQKNTLMLSFFTLDFMVAGFLGMLYMVIPQISDTWWASDGRPLSVFISGAILWGLYTITVGLATWRQS